MLTSASRPPVPTGAPAAAGIGPSAALGGRIALVAILVLAAALRLIRLNYAEYRGDDDDMVMAAITALHHGWLQSHGLISSIPVDNGPVAMWLLMLPLAVTSSLLVAQVWVALVNVASVALCFWFVRDTWNTRTALIATALFAVSPWAVVYSRRLWITAFDAPLALLAFWSLYRWLRWSRRPDENDSADASVTTSGLLVLPSARWATRAVVDRREYRDAALCGLAFSAFFQAHVVPMGEAVALLLTLIVFHRVFKLKPVLVALATLVVTMAPYVFTTVLPALSTTLAGEQSHHLVVDGLSWYYFGNLVTGLGYQSVAPQGSRLIDATSLPFGVLAWLSVALLAIGCLAAFAGCLRGLRRRQIYQAARAGVLLLWALIPPLGLMVHLVEVHPYYFVVSMPAIYVLEALGLLSAGRGTLWLLRRFSSRGAPGRTPVKGESPIVPRVAVGLTAVLAGSQLLLALPFFVVIPEYWTGADYGIPLEHTLRLVNTARTLAAGAPVVVGGFDHDVHYTLYSTLRRADTAARYADDRNILMYATAGPPVVYLTTDDGSWEAQTLRGAFGDAQKAVIRLPGQGETFRYFQPTAGVVSSWATTVVPPRASPWRFGDAAEIDGAALQAGAPGASAVVWLSWRLLQDPPQPLIMRLEVTGGDGYVWTTADAVSYPAGYWTAGDAQRLAFVNRLSLPLPSYLPPGSYDVRVRLLGIQDGKQFGAPAPLGKMNVPAAAAQASAAQAAMEAAALPHAQSTPVAPGLSLMGWRIDSSSVRQNGTLGVVLFWYVSGRVTALPTLQVVGSDGAPVTSADNSELAGTLPPDQWPRDRLLADRHLLHVGGRAAPGVAVLRLSAQGASPLPLAQVTVDPLPRLMTLPPVSRPAAIGYGGVIQLAGYDVQPERPTPGQALQVTLYWQAIGPPSTDETVFVHVYDAAGTLVAQDDGPPAGGSAPTTTWIPGQVVKDAHTVTLPASLPAGTYHLTVGLYNLQTGDRLAITAGAPAGATGADLGTIQIGGPAS